MTWSRRGLGVFFCAMAGYNLFVVRPDAEELYRDIAEELAWPGVAALMSSLVLPRAAVFAVALAAFEITVGLLMMTSGRRARVALWCAVAFMVGLLPIVSYYAFANLPLVVLALVLLRRDEGLAVNDADLTETWAGNQTR
ncbi:MAG: hypothetical protein WCF36_01210 [Candidatus Nanopelagicales bacterium]